MADHLQLEHWLTKAVEALRADAVLSTRGYKLIETGDLEHGYFPANLSELLPAILVSCRAIVTPSDLDLGGIGETYGYGLRFLAIHSFEDASRVWPLKSQALGELHAAVRAVQNDGARFTNPTTGHQFFWLEPTGFEPLTEEEKILHESDGFQNTFAVAATFRLAVKSRSDQA